MEPIVTFEVYSDRSSVMRTDPEDFLESYGGHLAPFYCKWNNDLKAPDGEGKLGGWILPKKHQEKIAAVVDKIKAGQLAPLTSREFHAQTKDDVKQAPLTLRSAAKSGYQQITIEIIKPEVNQTLYLNIGTQKIPALVQDVTSEMGIVKDAIIKLPDNQRTSIKWCKGKDWFIPGFEQKHTISLE